MYNKVVLLLLVLAGFSVQQSNAQGPVRQSTLDFGIMLGGSNYNGDLVSSAFEMRGTHFNAGLITRWNPVQRLAFRLSANYGHISGDDRWYTGDDVRTARNIHYKSAIWDFTGAVEINLRTLDFQQTTGVIPYVMAGASVFKFNPRAQFEYVANGWAANGGLQNYANLIDRDGDWVELQPLGTEGQETTENNDLKRYSLTQIAVPLGFGFKWRMNEHWELGVEYATRITFTDYLDDVSGTYIEPVFIESQYGSMAAALADPSINGQEAQSNRGESKATGELKDNNDMYSIFGITLTYKIVRNQSCPTFY
jgi:hypothetical protein